VILSYAGRLPGTAEFPDNNVEYVREQVERLITNLRPRVVVGSAAAGADLLVIGAALKSGVRAKIVLAGTAPEFRDSSVAGRGAEWEQLFDALVDHERVDVIAVPRHEDDTDSYAAVTKVIRDVADAESADSEPIVGLNVSAGRDGVDHSAALATAQELRERLVLRLDPSRRSEDTPTAFVAMPFGRRRDPTSGWKEYEADATYKRIILPALVDAGYRPVRADAEALLEVIDLTMLRAINGAEIVVADLATLNPNVMWEVGVRHAWRRAGTILLRPQGTKPPFDVSHARVHEYRRDETGVGDDDAIAGIELLRALIEAVAEDRVDSPVFMTFPALPEPRFELDGSVDDNNAAQLQLEQISLASDLRDAEELERLAARVEEDNRLEAGTRQALLEQIGFALIASGRHAAAARVIGPLAERDTAMDHIRLQQQYAHALIRSEEEDGHAERLQQAEQRLRALRNRGVASSETLGLLGSAAKARVEDALAAGRKPGAQLNVAIDAYLDGFRLDPGDYYPGIVALALLRLRGQRIAPNEADIALARELLPVVRFSVTRLGQPTDQDVWRLATIAELHLNEYLLNEGNNEALVQATTEYSRVGAVGGPDHRASAARQLRLLRDAGDPADVLDAILDLFS
jgi:MAP3K TRAFs-binding domain